jgi:exonuclease III
VRSRRERKEKRMEKVRRERRKNKETKRRRKLLFWNVAGVSNKDRDFWKFVTSFDFISLCKTWVNEKGWDRLKNRLPDSHEWAGSYAKKEKEKKKGRCKGGFIIGRRKGWDRQGNRLSLREVEGAILTEISLEKEKMSIVSVYSTEGEKKLREKIDELVVEKLEEKILIGGDFNLRLGEMGVEETEDEKIRRSKDKTIGNGGRKFIEWLQEKGWYILNGAVTGDWEREYTYVGARGSTVIDYIIGNDKLRESVCNFKVGERVDSDHMPLCLELEEEEVGQKEAAEEEAEEEEGQEVEIIVWDEEAIR